MSYIVNYDKNSSVVQLINNNIIIDQIQIPKNFFYADYLAIIQASCLALKNNIKVFTFTGIEQSFIDKINVWFGQSFKFKFKYINQSIDFWIKNTDALLNKIFDSSSLSLIENAIIFIFAAIDKIICHNPLAITVKAEKLKYFTSYYDKNIPLESQLSDFNLFSDASLREDLNFATIAGFIKNKHNQIIVMFRKKLTISECNDSNKAEMLAILHGIQLANTMNIQHIKVFTDSMCSIDKIKNFSPYIGDNFYHITHKIIQNLEALQSTEFVHINRNFNQIADNLTKF